MLRAASKRETAKTKGWQVGLFILAEHVTCDRAPIDPSSSGDAVCKKSWGKCRHFPHEEGGIGCQGQDQFRGCFSFNLIRAVFDQCI